MGNSFILQSCPLFFSTLWVRLSFMPFQQICRATNFFYFFIFFNVCTFQLCLKARKHFEVQKLKQGTQKWLDWGFSKVVSGPLKWMLQMPRWSDFFHTWHEAWVWWSDCNHYVHFGWLGACSRKSEINFWQVLFSLLELWPLQKDKTHIPFSLFCSVGWVSILMLFQTHLKTQPYL